ncbi:hypothetical protein F383_32753 [Gossypium arboreum]|uniref:Uncharacterized protein n=1 Tax=Gossypium arboreum TaxID=29729 RepID=A0A0B0PLN8_GOSAR|nr:hypothetical protein F383_32753 [Gossypium arboreum]
MRDGIAHSPPLKSKLSCTHGVHIVSPM